ncbi:MAG: cupredoxin domain-containing protein [Actinomycetota bacterium]
MRRRWMRLLGAVFALTLLAAACGGDDPDVEPGNGGETPSEAEEGENGGADLTIVDFGFSPTQLSVTEGQTITVTNIGETSHTFTTEDEAVDETIGAGETVEIQLTGVTSGGFVCRFHSQMTGTLTVG